MGLCFSGIGICVNVVYVVSVIILYTGLIYGTRWLLPHMRYDSNDFGLYNPDITADLNETISLDSTTISNTVLPWTQTQTFRSFMYEWMGEGQDGVTVGFTLHSAHYL